MRERQIHPAIFVEVEHRNAHRRRGHSRRPRLARRKLPFPWILVNRRRGHVPCRSHKINRPVIVRIRAHSREPWPIPLQREIGSHIRKRAVAVVPEHDVRANNLGGQRADRWLPRIKQRICTVARYIKIDVAVMIVVYEGHAHVHQTSVGREIRRLDARCLARVFELAVFLVMQQQHTVS